MFLYLLRQHHCVHDFQPESAGEVGDAGLAFIGEECVRCGMYSSTLIESDR